jgi:regulator of protease activity HflC (stomatin/prohibitin superfamily)
MLELLSKLLEKLFIWLPRFKIITRDIVAVRVTLGVWKENLETGFYWYWPLITDIEEAVCTPQTILFDSQFMTRDGQNVETICDAVYVVEDPRLALLLVEDYDKILASYAEHYLGEFIASKSLKAINDARDEDDHFIGAVGSISDYVYDKLEQRAGIYGLSLLDVNVRAFCTMMRIKTGE